MFDEFPFLRFGVKREPLSIFMSRSGEGLSVCFRCTKEDDFSLFSLLSTSYFRVRIEVKLVLSLIIVETNDKSITKVMRIEKVANGLVIFVV
jgi:hypothetical protein